MFVNSDIYLICVVLAFGVPNILICLKVVIFNEIKKQICLAFLYGKVYTCYFTVIVNRGGWNFTGIEAYPSKTK